MIEKPPGLSGDEVSKIYQDPFRQYNTEIEYHDGTAFIVDHKARPDFNRDVIISALRFVVDRAGAGDEAAAALLKSYTIKSASFDYEGMPERVASQITFRDQLPDKIKDVVNELRGFTAYNSQNCFDEVAGRGHGKSCIFSEYIQRADATLDMLAVPDICSDEVEFFIDNGYSMELDWSTQDDEPGSYQEDLEAETQHEKSNQPGFLRLVEKS